MEPLLMGSVALEQIRVRNLTALPQVELPFLPIKPLTPKGIAGDVGSIGKSTAIKTSFSAPQIPIPEASSPTLQSNSLWKLMGIIQKNDELSSLALSIFEADSQNDIQKLEHLHETLKATMAEHFKSLYGEKMWGVWQNVFQDFFSALTIAGGAALIGSGAATTAGALMVAAGGLSLTNRILVETGGWKILVSYFTQSNEMQEKVARRLEAGFFLLSAALGLTAGTLGFQAGALIGNVTVDLAFKTATVTTTFLGGVTKLKKASIKDKTAIARAKIIHINAQTANLQHQLRTQTTSIEDWEKLSQQMASSAKQAIQLLDATAS